jgi:outer membrane scaffolding protein for murein synthesis (MipA/OmpV family)
MKQGLPVMRWVAGLGWVLAAVAALGWARPAVAQTPSPMAEWQFSSGVQLERLFEPTIPTWRVEFGLAAQYAPEFDGLNRYQVQPGPAFDVRYKDIAFASTGEGVGVNLFSFRHVSGGVAVSYDLGRSPHLDGEALTGLGTIHAAPEVKLFATYALAKAFPLTIRLDVRKQIGATNGYIGDVGAYLPMPGSSQKFAWFVGPTVTMADQRYMQAYFGVSRVQAQATKYRQFQAYGGFKSAGLGASAVYFFTPHTLVDVSGAFDRLLGSAAESPITENRYEEVVSVSALYKF